MTSKERTPSTRRLIALAITAFLAAVSVLAATPAHAEKVVGHDPNDADFYDIETVTVQHREERVRFTINAYDRTPYSYYAFVDTPGGKPWKYAVVWSAYTPHRVWVKNRKQFNTFEGSKCELFSARELTTKDVTFSVPVDCLNKPNRLRVRTKSWDDEAGIVDRTGWTEWANRG